MKKVILTITFFFSLVFCLNNLSIPAEPENVLKEIKTPEGITYLSGGIGLDERESIQKMGKDYNLKLVFAAIGGDYLANIEVMIEDDTGKKVLEAVSQGPWFYVKLQAGKYRITAKSMDKSLHQFAQVTQKGLTQLTFHWKK